MHRSRSCSCKSDPNFCHNFELEQDIICDLNCFKSNAPFINRFNLERFLKRKRVTVVHFSSQIEKNLHHRDQRHENFERVLKTLKRNNNIGVAKIDADSNPSLLNSAKYGYKINRLPAVVIFKNGKGVNYFDGYPIPVNADTIVNHANVILRMPLFCKWGKWDTSFVDVVTQQTGVCTAACEEFGTLIKTRSCECPYANWGDNIMRGPVNCTSDGNLKERHYVMKHRCKGSCPKSGNLRLMYYQQSNHLKVSRAAKVNNLWFVQKTSSKPLTIYTGKLSKGNIFTVELDTKGQLDRKTMLGISKSINSRNNIVESDNFLLKDYPSYGFNSYRGEIYGPKVNCSTKTSASEELDCELMLKNSESVTGIRAGPPPTVLCSYRYCGGYKVAARKIKMVVDMKDDNEHKLRYVMPDGSDFLAQSGNFNDFYVHIGFSGEAANVTVSFGVKSE